MANYQKEMVERNKLIQKFKVQFPEKYEEMIQEIYPEGSKRLHRKYWNNKWSKIVMESLTPNIETPKVEEKKEEITTPTNSNPEYYKGIKLFNPHKLEPDPRGMTLSQLTEYVHQLGIDTWIEIPPEYKKESGYLQDNRVFAFKWWNTLKLRKDLDEETQKFMEFNSALNEMRLKRIDDEVRSKILSGFRNTYVQGDNGPEIHLYNGMIVDKNTVILSTKRISGNYFFQKGHVYAFYSEERDFLTVMKVNNVIPRHDNESNRLEIQGVDFRGDRKVFFYRFDSSLALELS